MRILSFILATSVVVSACQGPSQPVPIRGDATQLTGQWVGEYHSAASGRSGSIVFTLEAGADTARGDVIMIPGHVRDPGELPLGHPHGQYHAPRSELLTIGFVWAGDGRVAGRLDPYRDPECGCELATSFDGQLEGNVLSGTYRSRHQETGRLVEGRWRVTRRASDPPGS